jgi:hypothetical protein
MIKVKICGSCGYVTGDGDIPGGLSPDEFMELMMNRIYEAKVNGLSELELENEKIEAIADMFNKNKERALNEFNNTRMLEYGDNDFESAEELVNAAIPASLPLGIEICNDFEIRNDFEINEDEEEEDGE